MKVYEVTVLLTLILCIGFRASSCMPALKRCLEVEHEHHKNSRWKYKEKLCYEVPNIDDTSLPPNEIIWKPYDYKKIGTLPTISTNELCPENDKEKCNFEEDTVKKVILSYEIGEKKVDLLPKETPELDWSDNELILSTNNSSRNKATEPNELLSSVVTPSHNIPILFGSNSESTPSEKEHEADKKNTLNLHKTQDSSEEHKPTPHFSFAPRIGTGIGGRRLGSDRNFRITNPSYIDCPGDCEVRDKSGNCYPDLLCMFNQQYKF